MQCRVNGKYPACLFIYYRYKIVGGKKWRINVAVNVYTENIKPSSVRICGPGVSKAM